jgi:EAL domain-containing protein (putative c-di-GMP-specific phosphodiesterase class I)
MTTTAEGVETQEQLNALRALGCTQMQGYLFSAAVPASAIPRLLSPIRFGDIRERRAAHAGAQARSRA